MAQTLERKPIESGDIIRLLGLTDLELSTTTTDNYELVILSRIKSLDNYNGLTAEEIEDIQEYRSDSKNTKQFSSVEDLISDLND